MKNIYLFVSFFCFLSLNAQVINFTDANFKAILLAADENSNTTINLSNNAFKIDANTDGEIDVTEANQVHKLYISDANITDLTGISSFLNLRMLFCCNNQISNINIPSLYQLKILSFCENQVTNFDASIFQNLEVLNCSNNPISELAINSLPHLNKLIATDCGLTSLELNNLPMLNYIDCSSNFLEFLNVSECASEFKDLYIQNNEISNINMSNITKFERLNIRDNNLNGLDISNVSEILFDFSFGNNPSDYVNFKPLLDMNMSGRISYTSSTATNLDLTGLKGFGGDELISSLAIENCPNLESINFKNDYNNIFYQFPFGFDANGIENMYLEITNCPSLNSICCDVNEKNYLDVIVPEQITVYTDCAALGNSSSQYESIELYPNPVVDYLYLNFGNDKIDNVFIYNLLGQLVLESNTSNTIDVSNLKTGTYLIKIQSEDQIVTEKFIKQ
jgi:Secretion system C-terminal sorting domain